MPYALAVQQCADFTVPVAHSCLSDLADPHPQLSSWIQMAAVAIRGSCHAQNPARMSLPNLIGTCQVLNHRPTPRRLYHFF